jgi:hypothetical protein
VSYSSRTLFPQILVHPILGSVVWNLSGLPAPTVCVTSCDVIAAGGGVAVCKAARDVCVVVLMLPDLESATLAVAKTAAIQLRVQQKPHAMHAAAFSGSNNGDPGKRAVGHKVHPTDPVPEVTWP